MGIARHKYLTMIVAFLAAAQMVCACYSASATDNSPSNVQMAGMSHHGDCGTSDLDGDEHGTACIHCDGAAIVAELQQFDSKPVSAKTSPEFSNRTDAARDISETSEPDTFLLNRWHDPPRQSPVTMKVKLLN